MTTSQPACYFPDRSVADTYQICNTTLAGPNGAGSTCCDAGSVCTTGGYCIGRQAYAYRGACTDETWRSLNCASQCLDTNPNGPCNTVPCGPSGVFNDAFCCSAAANKSCCASTFVNVFDFPYSPSSLVATNPQSISTAAVGAGVGVPLSVLLLSSLCFLLYRERKRGRGLERDVDGMRTGGSVSGEHGTLVVGNMPHEVGGSDRIKPELSSVQVYEVGSN